MFCSTCGYNVEATASSQMSPAANKFCRRCGTRLQEDDRAKRTFPLQTTLAASNLSPLRNKNFWHIFQESRRGKTHAILIAAMWLLTMASWMFWLALEQKVGTMLDFVALALALVLIFLPSTADRINGWTKIGIEAASLVIFVISMWHQ
jgi:hypothetical protein